jgi:2,3-bisphosphoglycerate-independent phosphoglycerate mutase
MVESATGGAQMNWKLEQHASFPGVEGPVLVCVMDGVGIGRQDASDAVWLAQTPNLDRLRELALTTQLSAHGRAVGMPSDGDMGNSEVGHNALGAGRTFDQGAKLVSQAIASGSLFEGETWRAITQRARNSGQPLHFIGLLSDGNVHSHIDHLFALLRRCHQEEIERVRIHVLLDGRDVPETSALEYVDALEALLTELNQARGRDYRIASGGGRMAITMDRYEADWAMVEKGWKTHVHGDARGFSSARHAIETFRDEERGLSDQWLPPFVVVESNGESIGRIEDRSSVIFFNFRGDRAIEISQAFESENFGHFERGNRPDVLYAGMMQYDGDLLVPKHFLVRPPAIDRTLGEYLARNSVAQLAISETQKFGHVTYFWNGNRSGRFDDKLETYFEIPSDRVPFDQAPEMKAREITDQLIGELQSGRYRHARINYANGDMVGHTGNLEASVQAVECVDGEIGRLLPLIEGMRGALLVTADHGNADCMFDIDEKSGEAKENAQGGVAVKTSHTLNPVPLHVYAPGHSLQLAAGAADAPLAHVSATVLHLLGLQAPDDYEASLIAN